jgi:cell division protein FtsQ
MPAALRGGSRVKAKPRAKTPAKPNAPRRAAPRQGVYAPKLGQAKGVGLAPKQALMAAAGVLVIGLVATLATGNRAQQVATAAGMAVDSQFAVLGFRLNALHIQGASPMAKADILAAAGLTEGQPLLGLDLNALRARIEKVVWVKEVRIVRLLPDTLILAVVERQQVAVWQHAGRTSVIDDKGQVIRGADPRRFPNLPLVVGQGANEHAVEILPALATRPRLTQRLEALVRVDDRRWDLRLKDGALVQLPATGEEEALIQLEQLDQRTRILELGFARIDLRNPDMVAVRPRDPALPGRLVADGV